MKEFEEFTEECNEKSNMCKYIDNGLYIINLIEMLVAADRDGNWELHVSVVEHLLPIFLEFDSINYLCHTSWYLEKIKCLKEDNSWLYEKFMEGHFVVKDREGKFNSVSPDMKLEQTIQRSIKDVSGGILGEQRRSHYVAEWNLIYHETHSIRDAFNKVTHTNLYDTRDAVTHYELVGNSHSKFLNKMVLDTLDVISKQGNIFFLVNPPRLRHFLTNQEYIDCISEKILSVLADGKGRYLEFKRERFVEKR